ncbi:MAG: glycine dehydrogenase (aminomethyl-transferring), partial [Bdellovibrionales bacterium]|nr:glycine dehydrogenase (aminomethyl-transferring) [Bdellovibrionales bacterium]
MKISSMQSCFEFADRHIGPDQSQRKEMLDQLKVDSLERLIEKTSPQAIQLKAPLDLPESLSETGFLEKAKSVAAKNKVFKSYIGFGYNPSHMPTVIQRNILENPAWYTAYTPYQAEIS